MNLRGYMRRIFLIYVMLCWSLSMWAVRYQDGDFVFDCNYSWNRLSATLMRYAGTDADVIVPASVYFDGNTYPVNYIGDEFSSPFVNNAFVEHVVLPDCVIGIGVEAFCGCKSLRSVVLGRETQYIGAYAFYQCPLLENVETNNQLTTIDSFAFAECSSLVELTLGRSVSHLGDCVFDQTQLATITLLNPTPSECSGVLSTAISFYSTCDLYVRIGHSDAFKSIMPWSQFRNILEKPEKGDANSDGYIDIGDLNVIINIILGQTEYKQQCDLDENGNVDIGDVNFLINIILGIN